MKRIYGFLTILMICVGIAFVVGWLQHCATGHLTTFQYAERFWYDLIHLGDTEFVRRIRTFFFSLIR